MHSCGAICCVTAARKVCGVGKADDDTETEKAPQGSARICNNGRKVKKGEWQRCTSECRLYYDTKNLRVLLKFAFRIPVFFLHKTRFLISSCELPLLEQKTAYIMFSARLIDKFYIFDCLPGSHSKPNTDTWISTTSIRWLKIIISYYYQK